MPTPSEIKERNRLLVAELRSGRHNQGYGILNDGQLKCCLGVACIVAFENGLPLEVSDAGRYISYDDKTRVPPPKVVEWFGWNVADEDACNPILQTDVYRTAMDLNDSGLYDFHAIADAFERTYVGD